MDSASKKPSSKHRTSPKLSRKETATVKKVQQMFDSWLQDTSGYDENTWPELKKALDENHSRTHRLFNE